MTDVLDPPAADLRRPRFMQTLALSALTAGGLGVAFLAQWYTVFVLGPGRATDALFAASTLPQLVVAVVTGSLMHVLVPLFAGEGLARARGDAWFVLSVVSGVFTSIAVAAALSAQWWAPLLAPGFDPASRLLLIQLTRVQLIGMVFTGASGVLWAYCNSRDLFIRVAATQLFAAVLSLAVLWMLLPRYGVRVAAWLAVARTVLQFVLLIPTAGRPQIAGSRQLLREVFARLRPLLGGAAYYRTDVVIDRILSSLAAAGVLSLLSLAQQLYAALTQIINGAFASPLVPRLASAHKRGDDAGFRRVLIRGLVEVGALSGLVIIAVATLGRPLLGLIVGRGGVTRENIGTLYPVLLALSGAFAAGALGQIVSSSFYARGDTSTPTRVGVFWFTVFMPVKILSFVRFGIMGLAISSSLFVMSSLTTQMVILRRRLRMTHAE